MKLSTTLQIINCDFSPLIDHYSAVEYATKYATKPETSSAAGGSALDAVLRRLNERDDVDDGDSATRVFASYLNQQVGSRDWSAQEVSHVSGPEHPRLIILYTTPAGTL